MDNLDELEEQEALEDLEALDGVEEEDGEEPMTRTQRLISLLVTLLLVLTVLVCVYAVVQVLSNGYVNFGGFMMFRVVTGSMEPAIPVGALLVTREVDINTVALNDIVCFRTQEAEIWGKIVTHRVVEILETGSNVLLRTQGDANLVADGYLVNAGNFVGKVIWHTGEESILASIFSFFTNKVGFLGCIVFPCLLLAGVILKDCVGNIRSGLREALEELEAPKEELDWENDPLCGMTPEEYKQLYEQLYEQIRAELMEELMRCGEISKTE